MGSGIGGPCQEVALATANELKKRYDDFDCLKVGIQARFEGQGIGSANEVNDVMGCRSVTYSYSVSTQMDWMATHWQQEL